MKGRDNISKEFKYIEITSLKIFYPTAKNHVNKFLNIHKW